MDQTKHDCTWEQVCLEVYRRRVKFAMHGRTDHSVVAWIYRRSEPQSFLAALEHAAEVLLQSCTEVVEVRDLQRITREINDAKIFLVSCALWHCDAMSDEDPVVIEAYTPYREQWLQSVSASARRCSDYGCESIGRMWWRRRYYLASSLLTLMGLPAELADSMCASRIVKLENNHAADEDD